MRLRFIPAILLLSCAGAATPAPRASPTITAAPRGPVCDANTLEAVGQHPALRLRGPVREMRIVAGARVRREVVHCNGLAAVQCIEWAERLAASRARSGEAPRASPRHLERGSRVTLRVDGELREQVFATRAAYIARLHELERRGHRVQLVSDSRAFDYDFRFVDVVYSSAPRPIRVPEVTLEWTPPADRRGLWEAWQLLHERLDTAGVVLDEDSARRVAELMLARLVPESVLDEAEEAFLAHAFAVLARVQAIPPPSGDRGTLSLRLVVRCPR